VSSIRDDIAAVLNRIDNSALFSAVASAELGPAGEQMAVGFIGALAKLVDANAADKAEAVKAAHDQGVAEGTAVATPAPPQEPAE
jgi:hypothetical protein